MWTSIKGFFGSVFGWFLKAGKNQVTRAAVRVAATVAGNMVGNNNPDLAGGFRHYYRLYQSGGLTAELVNQGLDKIEQDKDLSPSVVDEILGLAEMVGAEISARRVVNLAGLDNDLFSAAVTGFASGMARAN